MLSTEYRGKFIWIVNGLTSPHLGAVADWEADYSEIDLVDILFSLWKRKILIALVTSVCVACAAIYLLFFPHPYESRTTLLFFPPVPSEIESDAGVRNVVLTPDTYVMLATADDLLSDVIAAAYAELPEVERPSLNSMRNMLKVKLAESSERAQGVPAQMAMSVSFRDKDPERAMKVLNFWTTLFIERNAQLFTDRTGATSEFLGKSVESVKNELQEAEKNLLAYQKENNISLMKIRLDSIQQTYSTLLIQYEEKLRALPPLEATKSAAAQLLEKEPETKTLSRGMSREAMWNLASHNQAEAGKWPDDFNVSDEIKNELHDQLKARYANAEIEIASLCASIKDLCSRIEKAQTDYAKLYARILSAETELGRLTQEKATLQESYSALSKQYQRSRVATGEATAPIKIVEKPIVPSAPVSRGGVKILCLVVSLGLFMETTAALVVEMFAKRASELNA